MQAVILAAGEGKRLRPVTDAMPKGLIEITGKPILNYSLDALSQSGINEVVIAVGFLEGKIREAYKDSYKNLKIDYVLNEEYNRTGSMYSLLKAKEKIKGDIILLESDLLYDPMALKVLLTSNFKDCILAAELSGSGDEVYICVDKENKIIALGKNLPVELKKNALGELVGISKFSGDFLNQLFKKAEEDIKGGKLLDHYEEAVFAVNSSSRPVYALFCPGLAWVEVDNNNDLRRARDEICHILKRN